MNCYNLRIAPSIQEPIGASDSDRLGGDGDAVYEENNRGGRGGPHLGRTPALAATEIAWFY